jgi:integrase
MPTLEEFAAQYVNSRDLSEDYADRLQKRAKRLQDTGSEPAIEKVLTASNVNAFLKSLLLSPFTQRSYREDILTLWNAAADQDIVPYQMPRRIFIRRCPRLRVLCFTVDEARAIVERASQLKGVYPNGVSRRKYWPAAVRLAWDSGLRRGDVWAFDPDCLNPDGTGSVVQRKTGTVVPIRLRDSTRRAIDDIGGKQPCVWTLDATFFGRHFRQLLRLAAVKRGTFKWLRRSSGSYVNRDAPGAGRKHLGQQSEIVFERHYDAQLGAASLPMPPEL